MNRRALILTMIVIGAIVCGLLLWRVQDTRAKSARLESQILKGLTAEEVALILKGQAHSEPQAVAAMKESAKARQGFIRKMRSTLALAAEARREGLAEDPNFKINLGYKKNILLDGLYTARLSKEQQKTFYRPEELEAVWTNPENEKQFAAQMETMKTIQKLYVESRGGEFLGAKLEGDKLSRNRNYWARVKIASDRARADAEFMQTTEVQLRLKILEAGILASDYLNRHWTKRIRATDAEIATYLSAHPEYDLKKKREKAEMILQRARQGEDFGKLATEFSEDRSTRSKGGLYENVDKDYLWAEIERAALSLEQGQIADKVIETDSGFHIVKLENKQIKTGMDGGETIKLSVRHILLQNGFEEPWSNSPNVPPAFVEAKEIAKTVVERERYQQFVEAIAQRNNITLPEDFTVELPESVKADSSKTPDSTSETVAKPASRG